MQKKYAFLKIFMNIFDILLLLLGCWEHETIDF